MIPYAQEFIDYLDEEDIYYTEKDEHVVQVSFRGENLNSIDVYLFFDEDGDPLVQLRCWSIANFKSNERAAIEICNVLNAEYRWVKFYIDKDKDIVASIDAVVDGDICGSLCLFLIRRMINIVDEAYPRIAKARWA